MKLTAEEIIGLNSLLDGERIWGFHENIEPDIVINEKKRIALKLLEYGEKEIKELLLFLNTYKNANDYVVINELNIALSGGQKLALIKVEDGYQLLLLSKEWITEYISGRDNILFFRYKNNSIFGFDMKSSDEDLVNPNKTDRKIKKTSELMERYLG